MTERKALHLLVLLMGVLFLVSTALQFNDPDPLGWVVIYAAGGVACLLPRALAVRLWLAGTTALAAWIWAGWLAPRTLPDLVLSDLVKKMEDKTPQVELGREMLGLVILAAVLSCVAIAEWRRRAKD